ncbi:MAG: sugar phosphate nucleotidyltransferase [Candidatus Nanoarchaeia archaeon]|nr:sugar phosphate nucleotidyltransferase [Candidatus Nanoarchaeia archaeon]
MNEIAIVYPVAGIAARFEGRLKWLASVGPDGETLIEYSLNQAIKAGFNKIIFIISDKTEKQFKEKFGHEYKGVPVFYTSQNFDEKTRDKPWGTCDALCTIRDIIDCPFVFCNGDDIYGENTFKLLYSHLNSSDEEATVGYRLEEVLPEVGKYNRASILFKEDYVTNIKEKLGIEKSNLSITDSKLDDLTSMNIFALHKETIKLLDEKLKKFKEDNKNERKKECFIQEVISQLINEKKIKMKLYRTDEEWLGITYPEDEILVRNKLKEKKEIALVFLVAGLSSRFGGRIKSFAKVGPNQETLIEYSLNQALENNFSKIIFVVGRDTEKPFKEKFGNNYNGISVDYVLQCYDEKTRDRPWGTGAAVCAIKDIIYGPAIICNGDDIYGERAYRILFEHLNKENTDATVGIPLKKMISDNGTVNRGIFYYDKDNNIIDIKELLAISKKDLETNINPDSLANMGIFALHKETIDLLSKELEIFKKENENNRKKEFFITDQLAKLIKSGKTKMKIYSSFDEWLGITNPEDEETVRIALKNK